MNKVFWAIVAVDAALLVVLLVAGLTAGVHPDGGREMGLIFGVILPGLLIAAAVAVYVLSNSRAVRVVALAIVAAPLLLIAGAHLRSAWIDYQIRQNSTGADRRP
jgi:hypothetical protein